MTAMSQRHPRRQRVRAALTAFLLLLSWPAVAASDTTVLQIVLDQATIVRLPERVSTIVVGNPLIADVSIQAGGMMVVTGKGYGLTNVVALDRAGSVLMERAVEVVGPQGHVVVVYRGINRESYSCAPMCERRITLGDMPEFFQAAITQTGVRNAQAQTSQPLTGR
jgi:Flp pilus assembly secretin CpaC